MAQDNAPHLFAVRPTYRMRVDLRSAIRGQASLYRYEGIAIRQPPHDPGEMWRVFAKPPPERGLMNMIRNNAVIRLVAEAFDVAGPSGEVTSIRKRMKLCAKVILCFAPSIGSANAG